MRKEKKQKASLLTCFFDGDPDGNRTRVTAVKGRCLSRLTTGPYLILYKYIIKNANCQ